MDISVGPATDPDRFAETDHVVWFDEVPDLPVADQLQEVPPGQRFAADVPDGPDDTHAGVYGVLPLQLGVPGGLVPVAGLTWVGVHPDHRRRGVLSAMMRDHLARTRDDGLAISALHASEPAIYGRFGYGLAALELGVDLGRGTSFTAPGLEEDAARLRLRLATGTGTGTAVPERMRTADLALAAGRTGMVVGEPAFYERRVRPWPHELRDKEPLRVLFAQRDGEDVGFATFRRVHKWENARPGGEVQVGMLHGDPATRLALLRRLVDLDLMATVKLSRVSPDDPVFAWVGGGPRATGDVRTYDSTFARLVDLERAWAGRSYDADCDVVVDVADRFAPWNAGTWRLTASGGQGAATRTDAPAEVSLDVNVLGSAYLGRSVAPLLRAGLVLERREGAFTELALAMRTAVEPEPSTGF